MRKFHYLLLLFIFLGATVHGQKYSYYSTDSVTYVNAKLIGGGDLNNSKFIRVKKKGELVKYTPYEVEEYAFKDGRVYVSKEIQITGFPDKVFLERLATGDVTLYYYKGENTKMFFIENDSLGLVELPKHKQDKNKAYKDELLNITADFPRAGKAVSLLNYRKKPLSNFLKRYNQLDLFPELKYGLLLGSETAKLVPGNNSELKKLKEIDLKFNQGLAFGIFLDYPLAMSDFSLHSEVFYSHHRFNFFDSTPGTDLDFVATTSTLHIPLFIRFSPQKQKFQPFLNAGSVISFNIRNQSLLSKTSKSENLIEIRLVEENSISPFQIGLSAGGGMEYRLNHKNFVFFELRYTRQYGIPEFGYLSPTAINLFTGISF